MPPVRLPPTTQGPIEAVPCPHCGKANDFRPAQEQQLLDTGSTYVCDSCGRVMQAVGVRNVVMVTVRPTNLPPPGAGTPAAKPATTVGPGVIRRILGKR